MAHEIGVCFCHDQGCGGAGPVEEQIKAIKRMHERCGESADLRIELESLKGDKAALLDAAKTDAIVIERLRGLCGEAYQAIESGSIMALSESLAIRGKLQKAGRGEG